jgi:hypothetical protein
MDYTPRQDWLCCTEYKDRGNFRVIIEELDLSIIQKQIIQTRYIGILETFQKRTRNHSIVFFTGHFIVTVGSLFVPALLSIINSNSTVMNNTSFSIQIYWATFIISLLVTICNGILTLFRVDKKYYFLNTALERLRSEGWQYVGLTGRYSGKLLTEKDVPTHKNQFIFFTHAIEKLKLKQVEEEYYKMAEKVSDETVQTRGTHDLYPLSPDQAIIQMTSDIPEPVKNTVNSIIKSYKPVEQEHEHTQSIK